MKLDVLAVAAHRDDVEITIGGTLIKLAQQGYAVGVLDLTQGEMGSFGSPAIREQEAQASAKILGLVWRNNLNLPDSAITNTRENQLKLVKIYREVRPDILILPYWKGRHPDHTITPKLAYEAAYLSGLRKLEVESEKHRPRKIVYSTAYHDDKPSFVVDISAQMNQKLDALRCYKSQFELPPGEEIPFTKTDVFEAVRSTNRFYGMMIQKQYGEPYLINEMMEVDDLTQLTVKSI